MPSGDPRIQVLRTATTKTDTIAASAYNSTGINKMGFNALGFTIGTIDAAVIAVQVSTDNSAWALLRDGTGASVALMASGTGSTATSGSLFDALAPWPYVRLYTSASQTAARSITWVLQG